MGKELSEMSLEELWELFPVFLVPHNDKWNIFYKEMESFLKIALSECQVERISHIGSTAISGIWAKYRLIVDIRKTDLLIKFFMYTSAMLEIMMNCILEII